MYQLTTNSAPFVHYQCSCSRMFIEEEMYFCLKCNKGLCRFCLHEEMESFYCRSCLDVFSASEAATFKNKCSRYFQCPNCFTIMSVMVTPGAKIYYYNCQFCQYDTKQVDLKSVSINNLLMKINFYKGKYFKNPQQVIFEKLLEVYRYNQEEQIKLEKFQTRAKRKTVSFYVPGKIKKISKYFMADLEKDLEEKQKRNIDERKLKPFEEIYLSKLEMQKQEQLSARQYGFDEEYGMSMKSPRDQNTLSRSNTPRGQLLQQLSAQKAEKAKAEAAASKTNANGEEEAKDLPPEEFIDFLSYLDREIQILQPQDEKNDDEEEKSELIQQVSQPPGGFLSFEDAMQQDFDINQVSTLQQRLKNPNTQPFKVKDLYPGALYLLTKRTKRCKTCTKFVVKPNINPTSTEQLKVDFQLIYHVPKVTIYRIGKYQDGQQMEVLLKFTNPNMSSAKIKLVQIDDSENEDDLNKKLTAQIELPQDQIQIDAVDSINDQTAAETQKPNIAPEDEKYIYKKLDNFVVLKVPIIFKEGFAVETQEIYFGIKMSTESLRYGQHPFNLTIPVYINLGVAKKQNPVPPSQSSQRSARPQN